MVRSLLSLLFLLFATTQAELLLRNSTTIAGRYGFAGSVDGALGTATLAGPAAVAPFGADGGLLIGDNELIRYVKDETVSTWFGLPGVVGLRNGNKTIARVNGPTSMYYTADDGYLYFTEPKNNAIRRLNATHISSFVGSDDGIGGFVDGSGSTARFLSPTSLAYSSIDDTWYVTDSANSALRRVTRGGAVTTVATTSLNAPFYATSNGLGIVYILNRPTSSSVGIVVYFTGNGSFYQWISNTGFAHVAIGFDAVYQRLFAASQNRIHEVLTNNGTVVTVAGIGTAYLDGPNPRFNFINGIYVSSYRNMYVSCGPQAYVVRRLFFDPPPPLPVVLQFAAPNVFPIDNTTALNTTLAVLTNVVNAILGTNGTATVDVTLTYDAVTRTTNATVRVPNATYTNTSQMELQSGNYTAVFATLDAYYALTNFSIALDPLRFPFLLDGNATALSIVRAFLEAEVRSVLQYPYLFSPEPTWAVNATDGGNYSTWKLLLPASFQNSTTQQLLFGLPHASVFQFADSLYATDVFVNLSATFQLPYANATAMRDIRLLLQAEVEGLLLYAPAGVDALVRDAGGNTSARVYVPTGFSVSTNETTRALFGNATWSTIAAYLSEYYTQVHEVVFDATKFPWSDAAAVEAIRLLLRAELNGAIVGSSTKTDVDVVLEPVVNTTERTVRFRALVPMALDASLNVTQLIAGATLPSVHSYLEVYYRVSSAMYRVRRQALGLPVFNSTWMEVLRLAIGDDLAIAMAFANVGANSSVPTYAASSYTDTTTLLTSTDMLEFPLLLPPWLVNLSTTNATIATASFPLLDAALARLMVQNVSVVVDSSRLPLNNATAMETLRQLLTFELRRIANTTDPSLNVMPAVSIANTTTTRFDITVPVGALEGVNLTSIVELFLLALDADGSPLRSFVDAYYPSGLSVALPYDITPWSNTTTMEQVEQRILQDVRNALSGIASSSDAFAINTTTISKTQRTVTFGLLIPPVFAGANLTATKKALNGTAASLTVANAFLLDYFPKNISLILEAEYLPWADPVAMAAVAVLLGDYLADSVFVYANVGINGSTYNATTGLLQFKVIVPPNFDNATTAQLLANGTLGDGAYNASLIANLSTYLASYFATGYSATFAAQTLPTGNATAMEDIRKLVLLDLQATLLYENIGVKSFVDVVDNNTGTSFTSFPLLLPPSFDNSTTVNLLIAAGYTRVQAYLAVYYATPVPATPAPQFVYTSAWSVDSMPTANDTQMELLRQALAEDVTNTLKISVNVSSWQLSGDGIFAQYLISMATFANNATTGVLLQDINNYPIFQALLAAFTQGNFVSIGAVSSAVDEGCSRGCVIGVAAVGAVVVTVGVIGAVVATSKKRRTATVVAPKFSSVMEDAPEGDAKNPLEMA